MKPTRKPKRRPAPPGPEEIAAEARRAFARSGGQARAMGMTRERRAEVARAAAAQRWARWREANPEAAARRDAKGRLPEKWRAPTGE